MTDPVPSTPPIQAQGLTLKELTLRIISQWILIGCIWLAVVIGVLVLTFTATPRFQSTAVLRVLPPASETSLAQQFGGLPGASLLGLNSEELETEIGVLRSRRIAGPVVDSLALTVQVSEPIGDRRAVIRILAVGSAEAEAELDLRYQGDGSYTARLIEPDQPAQELPRLQPGQELEYRGYRLQLAPEVPEQPPARIRVQVWPWSRAVADLQETLDIHRQWGGSRLLEVSYLHTDREMTADVVNAIVREYVAYKSGAEGAEALTRIQALREKTADYALRLEAAEETLRSFQEENEIYEPTEQVGQQLRRFAELQIQADGMQVERTSLAELLALIDARARERGGEAPDMTSYRQLATFPSLISNRAIQDLLLSLMELEEERSVLRLRRTDENEEVRRTTERIAELEGQLFRLGGDYLESLDGQLASLQEGLDRIQADMEALPEDAMEYARLLRDRTVLEEVYIAVEGQLHQAEVREAVRDEGVRILDPGLVPREDDPELPKPAVNLFLGLILGLTLGVAAALVRDLWNA